MFSRFCHTLWQICILSSFIRFCHVEEFTYLSVAKRKQAKLWYDMAKIQIKSEKHTPFGEIFSGCGAIWLHIVICNLLNHRSKVYNSLGHFNGYTFLNMQLRLKKISILRSVDGFCSKILICKVYFTGMWYCYLISLHDYFVIEMLRMRLFLYPRNLSIVFY